MRHVEDMLHPGWVECGRIIKTEISLLDLGTVKLTRSKRHTMIKVWSSWNMNAGAWLGSSLGRGIVPVFIFFVVSSTSFPFVIFRRFHPIPGHNARPVYQQAVLPTCPHLASAPLVTARGVQRKLLLVMFHCERYDDEHARCLSRATRPPRRGGSKISSGIDKYESRSPSGFTIINCHVRLQAARIGAALQNGPHRPSVPACIVRTRAEWLREGRGQQQRDGETYTTPRRGRRTHAWTNQPLRCWLLGMASLSRWNQTVGSQSPDDFCLLTGKAGNCHMTTRGAGIASLDGRLASFRDVLQYDDGDCGVVCWLLVGFVGVTSSNLCRYQSGGHLGRPSNPNATDPTEAAASEAAEAKDLV